MSRAISIAKALLSHQFRQDVVYIGSAIISFGTKLTYIALSLLLIEVLFANVRTIGGYTRNEVLLLLFVGQFSFYIISAFLYHSAFNAMLTINNGSFDYLLLKPVRAWPMALLSKASVLTAGLDITGNIIIFSVLINWSQLTITLSSAALAALTWAIGIGLMACFLTICLIPAFYTGQSKTFINLMYAPPSQPFTLSIMPSWLRFISFTFMPVYFYSAAVTAMLLSKVSATLVIGGGIVGLLFMTAISYSLWRKGLRKYASASS